MSAEFRLIYYQFYSTRRYKGLLCFFSFYLWLLYGLCVVDIFLLINVTAKLKWEQCFPTLTSISILSVLGCLVKRKMCSLPSQKSPRMDPNPFLYCFQSRLNEVRPILRLWIRVQPPPFVSISQKTCKYSAKCNRIQRKRKTSSYFTKSRQKIHAIHKTWLKLTFSSGVPRKSSLGSLYSPEIL